MNAICPRFLEQRTVPGLLLGPDGEQVPLPEEMYRVLAEIVEAMREGKVITLVPRTQRLTTQEAAELLGASPAYCGHAPPGREDPVRAALRWQARGLRRRSGHRMAKNEKPVSLCGPDQRLSSDEDPMMPF